MVFKKRYLCLKKIRELKDKPRLKQIFYDKTKIFFTKNLDFGNEEQRENINS